MYVSSKVLNLFLHCFDCSLSNIHSMLRDSDTNKKNKPEKGQEDIGERPDSDVSGPWRSQPQQQEPSGPQAEAQNGGWKTNPTARDRQSTRNVWQTPPGWVIKLDLCQPVCPKGQLPATSNILHSQQSLHRWSCHTSICKQGTKWIKVCLKQPSGMCCLPRWKGFNLWAPITQLNGVETIALRAPQGNFRRCPYSPKN